MTPAPSFLLSLTAKCLMILACLLASLTMTGCVTLGPTTEVRYLIVHPGQPIRVLAQTTVRGERLDGGGPADFDVGGWVMMPPDHWNTVEKLLKKSPLPVAPVTP